MSESSIIIPATVTISQQAARITELTNVARELEGRVHSLERRAETLRQCASYYKMVMDAVNEDDNMLDAWETFLAAAHALNEGTEKTPDLDAMLNHPAFKNQI